jgi:hypothetical protein
MPGYPLEIGEGEKMIITLSDINWLAAFPLGLAALFFLLLGYRRGVRFFDHESNSSQKERQRDNFLASFDIAAFVFCIVLAMSPVKLWLLMIPIGIAALLFCIPVSILGSYYQLYEVTGFMPKNAGIQVQHNGPGEKPDGKVVWYEFIPFIFIAGWLTYFFFRIFIFALG